MPDQQLLIPWSGRTLHFYGISNVASDSLVVVGQATLEALLLLLQHIQLDFCQSFMGCAPKAQIELKSMYMFDRIV